MGAAIFLLFLSHQNRMPSALSTSGFHRLVIGRVSSTASSTTSYRYIAEDSRRPTFAAHRPLLRINNPSSPSS
eukprot:scaffold39145_cov167-Skeletonema_dohrnii-CCMP3373.AAC.3